MLADRVVQSLTAFVKFRSRFRLRLKDEPRMRESMIANDVSRRRNGARNIRPLLARSVRS